jgi:poly-beta-1,6-N-acetyl-D-glucosamine synthase
MKTYIIISPVRNEEEYIEKTILSVTAQTLLPAEWIIVNDGSTDNTAKIIYPYLAKYPWIKCIHLNPHHYHPGGGVVHAFYAGYKEVCTRNWRYVVKLDGDLEFGPHYFESLFDKFEAKQDLGMASGKTFIQRGNKIYKEPCTDDHVVGATKVYRRDCFEAIGGLIEALGWDTIDELKAQVLSWETFSYEDLVVIHHRKMGFRNTDWSRGRFINGKCQWFLGYHPLYVIFKGCYRMIEMPFVIGGLAMILGYFTAMIKSEPKYENKEVLNHLKKKQLSRLRLITSEGLSKKSVSI